MKTVRVKIDINEPDSYPQGRIDAVRVDSTSEEELVDQQREDDSQSMRDMAKFVRRVRNRLGLTQQEFARRLNVSLETIRNWEQGRRYPTGAAKALLKVLDKAPEACLAALS